ncbi:phage tail domain-containing protein [Gemella sp. zg-1178]|uniref:phage tail domain-containing protein n=1 Tax=Gemella sp. zg-1178 TaxID=2840372 RepID=UPI001C03FA96|nr:phage tail domain-containing protein [Gemella sp. zg-1178]MBU0279215.1 phage tail family protein [Gemella sp. zg-1178]
MFSFKGVSSDSLGLVFSYFPNLPTGQKRTQFLTVPGRDGFLTLQDDSLEAISLTLEGHTEASRQDLLAFFSGEGDLVFDVYPDRYYRAMVTKGVEVAYPLGNSSLIKFLVVLECEPFSRFISNELVPLSITDGAFSVNNPYSLKAYPYLKIAGSGLVTFKRDGLFLCSFDLGSDAGAYVEVDSELNSVFVGASSRERTSKGKLPVLSPGDNIFSVEGNVTSIEIKYNWRLL